jgi:chorismate dehydratase
MSAAIPVSVVSYLNSKPFIYGLRNAKFKNAIDLQEDIPSVCAEKLINGKAAIGLVPVAVLPLLKNYQIISDYCIGADGKVNSVLLLSNSKLEVIKKIRLDYQSRTSVQLCRLLAKLYWKIDPEWEDAKNESGLKIGDDEGAVVIGDRALLQRKNYKVVTDLSEEWKKFTGMPFVFACWVSIVKSEDDFISEFNAALKEGLNQIDDIALAEASELFTSQEIKYYLQNCIEYNFDIAKKEAMNYFLKLISGNNLL